MSATEAIGDGIRTRLNEVDAELKEAQEKVKPLKDEKAALKRSLAEIDKLLGGGSSSNGSSAAVTDEQVIEVVQGAGEPISTAGVAEALGVRAINVARKLTKLVEQGKLSGTKDDGWATA